ncbi:hypothetical protein Hypma_001867 [Hypsizygus marmoreus]|uniref:Uncharacterized protein n=1 Tax=Hypsizygus marmoreus TaxID=39966 RepID=A0A369J739_HYPMA|nr:hypothetical protein Hypma_001867 [Hypsizygus marmoreus]
MDTSRPPPPQGAPPSYAFVTRVYRRNLRPVVLTTAFLGAIWSLFSGIGWFRNYGIDRNQNVPHIANLSIALGVCYMAVFVIGAFGIYSALTQRVALVRIYALLTALATLIIVATGLTRVVTHFVWKNDIIKECTTLTTDKQIVYYGFWGPISHDILDAAEAADWCQRYWNRDSWSEIVAFLILTILAALFTVVAFSYYRQLLDPTSPANASRAPSNQARMGAFPSHYNPPYNASVPNLPYGYNAGPYSGYQGYAPPAGPPPVHDDPFAPPGYIHGDERGKGFGGDDKDKDQKDPFADYGEERDVTSRPGPGGSENFR